MTKDRIAVFIDSGNFIAGLKRQQFNPIDYVKLSKILAKGRPLVRAYYYVGAVPAYLDAQLHRKQQLLFERLKQFPFVQIRAGRIIKSRDGWKEKGVDILLASDLVTLARNNCYDGAVVVTEDSDFVNAMGDAKVFGKRIEVATFTDRAELPFKRVASAFHRITPLVADLCSFNSKVHIKKEMVEVGA